MPQACLDSMPPPFLHRHPPPILEYETILTLTFTCRGATIHRAAESAGVLGISYLGSCIELEAHTLRTPTADWNEYLVKAP